jgi:uncharacterized protein (DUF2267 family)
MAGQLLHDEHYPLFFIDTLADLEKEARKGKTPEQVVGEIAYKTPDVSPRSNVHHMALANCHNSTRLPMSGPRHRTKKGEVCTMCGHRLSQRIQLTSFGRSLSNTTYGVPMTTTGLDIFDRTVQKSIIWVDAIRDELALEDRHRAYHLLRVVLHEIRDRLPMMQSVHLAAQLPILLRGVYYDGWSPSLTGNKKQLPEFLANIGSQLDPSLNLSAQAVAKCVLQVISEHVDIGEVRQIVSTMPQNMRWLWPDAAAA